MVALSCASASSCVASASSSSNGKIMTCRTPAACLMPALSGRSLYTDTVTSKFIGELSRRASGRNLKVSAGLFHDPSTEPGYYEVEKVYGAPIGKRLKLWNLPANCKEKEISEWFRTVGVIVESVEFTNDPELNAQGIGGFVELESKWDCCKAIVKLDGYKFKGNCIRMDFVEKAPFPPGHNKGPRPGYAGKNKANSWNSLNSYPSVLDSQLNAQTAPLYGGSSGYGNNKASSSQSTAQSTRLSSPPSSSTGPKLAASSSPPSTSSKVYTRLSSPPSSSTGPKAPPSSSTGPKVAASSPARWTNSKVSSASPSASATHSQPARSNSGVNDIASKYPSRQGNGAAQTDSYSQSSSLIESLPTFKSLSYDEMNGIDRINNSQPSKITRTGPMYGSPQPLSLNRLFVGHLPSVMDDGSLQLLFSKYGTVLEARVLRDQQSGKSRGLGVVAMSSVDEMKQAAQALDGSRVEGQNLKVNAVCGN